MTTLERLTLHIRRHGDAVRNDARNVFEAATEHGTDGIYPTGWSHSTEGRAAARVQTQCLLEAAPGARVDVTVRFLQVVSRTVHHASSDGDAFAANVGAASRWFGTAVRQAFLPDLVVADVPQCVDRAIHIDCGSTEEEIRGPRGEPYGLLVRSWEALRGRIVASSVPVGPDLQRISVTVDNTTCWTGSCREEARSRALLAPRTEIEVQRGDLVSLCDPPEHLRSLAEECRNLHTWPVLLGSPGERRRMLSSPEILFDYPERSAFDGIAPNDDDDRERAWRLLAAARSAGAVATEPVLGSALRPALLDEHLAVAESERVRSAARESAG